MGEPLVEIADEVENRGFAPADLMLLYHVNVGYPVVAPGSRLVAPDAEVVPRDEPAAALLAEHADFPPPRDGFEQLVYEHRLRQPDVERASIADRQPDLGADRRHRPPRRVRPAPAAAPLAVADARAGHVPDRPGARDLRHPRARGGARARHARDARAR